MRQRDSDPPSPRLRRAGQLTVNSVQRVGTRAQESEVRVTEKQTEMIGKLALSAMVCALGGAAMYLTAGETGIGWAVLGVALIWGHA